jgi:MoaA/NifB/PqqE/SkfB family radical SAM enzyme
MTITERIDNVVHVPQKWLREDPPTPISIKIELNSKCPYKCHFCVRSIRENDQIDMDRATFTRIMQDAYDSGVREAGLFYINEPFTVDWLPEAISECIAIGYPYVFLTTSGANATPQKVERCMAAGLDSLKFSLNFADAQQLVDVAKVAPRTFDRVLYHIKKAREIRDTMGYKTKIYASSIAFDGEQGERMKAVVEEIKPFCDEHYWLPLYGMSGASKAAGWKPRPGNPGRLDNMRSEPLPCWAVFTEAHVTADGKLAACCFGTGLDGDLAMADLKTTPFMEAWHSASFRILRKAHLLKDVTGTACQECAAA